MEQLPFLLLLFAIGFIASFVGNFVSGGTSLIGISSMLFFGVPPHLAVATQSVGTLGWRIGGFREFLKAKKIVWKFVLPLSIIAFLGSTIGAHILIATSEQLLNKIVGFIILLFIPLSLVKKNLGVEKIGVSKTKEYLGYLFYFFIAIWTGFFSAGTGVFFLYVYMFFFGLTILELKGTDKIPGMFLDIGAIIVFSINGIFNPLYLFAFFPGMFLGSTLGAKYAIKLGDRWLRTIILATVALMSLKLILK
jgi:hypothetical protein